MQNTQKNYKVKNIQTVSVCGLLVDKVIGSIHCKLTGHIAKAECEVKVRSFNVDILDATRGILSAESLCYSLQVLLQAW